MTVNEKRYEWGVNLEQDLRRAEQQWRNFRLERLGMERGYWGQPGGGDYASRAEHYQKLQESEARWYGRFADLCKALGRNVPAPGPTPYQVGGGTPLRRGTPAI